MNDRDLCLQVVSRSCQALRYIRRWISRKPLEIEAWFQTTTNRKWHRPMGVSNGHVTDDVTWPQRCCEAVRSAILAAAWLLALDRIDLSQFTLHARCCFSATHSCTAPLVMGSFAIVRSVNPKHDWINRRKCFSPKKLINRTIDLRRL